MGQTAHKQTWVKINAPVDSEIAELVEALSAFPGLETTESCQGGGDNQAWICFFYGDYWSDAWRSIAEFGLGFLAPGLSAEVGDDAHFSIHMTGSGIAQGHLSIRAGAVKRTTEALERLLHQLPVSHRS